MARESRDMARSKMVHRDRARGSEGTGRGCRRGHGAGGRRGHGAVGNRSRTLMWTTTEKDDWVVSPGGKPSTRTVNLLPGR